MKVHEHINENNWTQRVVARDQWGNPWVWPYSPLITQRCLTGMIISCYRDDKILANVLEKVKIHLDKKFGESNIGRWNDAKDRTWEEVRDLAKQLDI